MRGASFPSRRLREKRRETTENDDWRRREDSCNSPGRAIEPALLSLQPSTTFDLFDQSCKHRDPHQRPLSQPVDQFSPNIISLPLSSSKVANFELHYIEFYKEFSEIQEWIPISLFSFSTIFESINSSLPLSIQNSQFRITLHEIVLPFHPRKSCSPDGCTVIYHHRVFSIHDFPPHLRFAMHGASFPSPLRRSPLSWTQDTRGEGAVSFSLEEEKKKRQRETRRNVCKRECLRRRERHVLDEPVPLAGTCFVPKKEEKGEWRKMRTGRKCNRKEDARARSSTLVFTSLHVYIGSVSSFPC